MALLRVIRRSTLFQSVESSQLERVASVALAESRFGDTRLFQEGDRLDYLYVIHQGAVKLTMDVRLWNREATLRSIVNIVEAGGTFGWSALVEPKLATLSAQTMGPTRLVAIPGQEIRRLMDEDPLLGYRVMTRLAALVASRLRALSMSIMSERALDLLKRPLPV